MDTNGAMKRIRARGEHPLLFDDDGPIPSLLIFLAVLAASQHCGSERCSSSGATWVGVEVFACQMLSTACQLQIHILVVVSFELPKKMENGSRNVWPS